MNDDSTAPATPLFPVLTSSEYGALVALATRRSTDTDASLGMVGAEPRTMPYIEHRLVLLGLAIRVADTGDASRSVLILSTAGRMLMNDVHERDSLSGMPDRPSRGRVAHNFAQWSPRPRRSLHQHAETPGN